LILQFSKLPPPIGGVTIHVSRLIYKLKLINNCNIDAFDYSKERNLIVIFKKIAPAKIIHLHLSSKFWRFVFIVIFKLLSKKIITTFHGKYDFKNIFDNLSLRMSTAVIVLNEYSYNFALQIRPHGVNKFGAFIPPVDNQLRLLNKNVLSHISRLKGKYDKVFCTNASSLAFDSNSEEIYMGTAIISYFQSRVDFALVFCCPDIKYYYFLKNKFGNFAENIYYIKDDIDFINIIKITDGLIRATTVDGDSISIKEALYLEKPVFASNVVDRPNGVITFSDFSDLSSKFNFKFSKSMVEDCTLQIFQLYKSIL
jgi:hypothetical protein